MTENEMVGWHHLSDGCDFEDISRNSSKTVYHKTPGSIEFLILPHFIMLCDR